MTKLNRRSFLKSSALAGFALGFPSIIPASALGKDGTVAPSNRLQLVGVGLKAQGGGDMRKLLDKKGVQVIAVCDVDSRVLDSSSQAVVKKGQAAPKQYRDFRELLAKEKPDAAVMGLPDHWHAVISCAFLRAGVDVYGEKPLAKTFAEGRKIVDTVKENGRVWQTGMWQRSTPNFRKAVELVRNGYLGKILHVEAGTTANAHKMPDAPKPGEKPPVEVDYDLWVGPSAWMEYDPRVFHFNWRWNLNFGGGMVLDWVCHHGDIAAWAIGKDAEFPVGVEGTGTMREAPWNTPKDYDYTLTYADGVQLNVNSKFEGVKFTGEKGSMFVHRGGQTTSEPGLFEKDLGPDAWRCPGTTDHFQEFVDCCQSRRKPISHALAAHHATAIGHLGNAAIFTGRKLKFDGAAGKFVDDAGATAMLSRELRKPWSLEKI
ncbi:MAG: gfo/Idh/MocA family oxidoreductase [Verrucomicrobia bacterium]|nr:gfo/Idh/MocA family oxidoreductase [Verrucomicrobiota bacterium]